MQTYGLVDVSRVQSLPGHLDLLPSLADGQGTDALEPGRVRHRAQVLLHGFGHLLRRQDRLHAQFPAALESCKRGKRDETLILL